MHRILIRSVVLGVLAFAGCAESNVVSSPDETETAVDQAVTDPCLLQCQEQKLICMSTCPKDPFNPQNDCGCGAAFTLCKQQCATR
jgi:hypothetical protein